MNYLFMLTIGPVQSFIENSRKIKDMYAGSSFLSEIMDRAVSWMKENSGAEVIFPVETEQGKKANTPNRMIVRYRDVEERKLTEMANALEIYVRNYFQDRCIEILEGAGIGTSGINLAERQLRDFLEVYWLYVKYESSRYQDAYQRLFKGIQEVKGVRLFKQTEEPWGRKCALFPQFNGVFCKRNKDGKFPYLVNENYVYDITGIPSMYYQVKTNESLSAIALVKRMYDRNKNEWYSARLMLLLAKVQEAVFKRFNISIKDDVANALYDMVNGNLDEEEYEKEDIKAAEILKQYIEREHITLSTYYALIKFDGDDMGRNFINRKTEQEQRELSRRIGQFAEKAPNIIRNYGGLPAYSGGEDFYGFVPVDTMLQCLSALHQEFQATPELTGLTFSAGIAVAHLMQPLKDMTEMADEMEHAAKHADGKNAFAIGIIKRSGESVILPPYKMEYCSGLPEIADVILLSNVLKTTGCSRSLIFNISQLFGIFAGENKTPPPDMARILISDCVAGAQLDATEISKEKLVRQIMIFYTSAYGLRGFLDTLSGMAFLTREVI